MHDDQSDMSAKRIVGVLRRRWYAILLPTFLAAAAAFVLSNMQTKQYTATASLIFSSNQLNQQIAGLQPASTSDPQVQQATNVESVRLGDTAAQTAVELGGGMTAEDVLDSIDIAAVGNTNLINVSATAPSPLGAADLANTYSRLFVADQAKADQRAFSAALEIVKRRLADLSAEERSSSAGNTLKDREQSLAILAHVKSDRVKVAQDATVPTDPSSPQVARNTAVGGLLGLLIGVGVAFGLERIDRRTREPADLASIYDLPLLGIVYQSHAIAAAGRNVGGWRGPLPPREAEAFHMIRAHMLYLTAEQHLQTFLVTSAGAADGKTTVAYQLARADAAMRGGSRSLLIEADLRSPALARHLNLNGGPGLSDVLVGHASLAQAIQSVEAATSEGGQPVDVVVAGSTAPQNPGQLLESSALDGILRQAEAFYEFIILDSSPLAAVSDAFSLLDLVDGIIVVGRMGRRPDMAKRLHEALEAANAPLLGVVANGVTPRAMDQ